MPIHLKRAYDAPALEDGVRILVDRLWPRGVSKDRLQLDDWLKSVAPSDDLRKAFHQGDLDWAAFRRAYLSELTAHRETLRPLAERSRQQTITLVYSASHAERNNAVVLRQYLRMLGAPE
ncbi:DUF488 domain-containing protein [Marinobacter sp. JSM 1782161]|uniref:DUF488 domain-containing protein n=1 Tax=Marinobacter sp. JSM 1782161 TaxID=2685906 RepID=UPI001401E9F6|nr:DUF488 family protein [Marinobacter sp. JSM 1782161]